MAKPNEAKEIKPKADKEEGGGNKPKIDGNMKMIAINLATTVLICVLFLSINYVLLANLLSSKFAKPPTTTEENLTGEAPADGEASGDEIQRGIIVDLGDFILNLSDVSPRKYLKVNVALEVSKTAADAEAEAAPAKKEGHGEGGAAAEASPVEAEMAQFKPAIRDAVITTLSSKTSSELSTVAGKELAKEQITEAVNGLFAGEREIIRVSFGQFIIQ